MPGERAMVISGDGLIRLRLQSPASDIDVVEPQKRLLVLDHYARHGECRAVVRRRIGIERPKHVAETGRRSQP